MTKKDALTIAANIMNDTIATMETIEENEENELFSAVETINAMIAQLSKPHAPASEESKAKANEKRRAETAAARAELVAAVAPVLHKYLTEDKTAKELFEVAAAELPQDFSAAKVQNILLREMASEVVKTEAKGKANTYRLA